jgi:hypothetical protein
MITSSGRVCIAAKSTASHRPQTGAIEKPGVKPISADLKSRDWSLSDARGSQEPNNVNGLAGIGGGRGPGQTSV